MGYDLDVVGIGLCLLLVHVGGVKLCLGTTASNGKTEEHRKTCPSAILSTTNPIRIDPGLRGERLSTNRLSHDTAKLDVKEKGCEAVGCISLAQSGDMWRSLVKTALNLRVP
jgi:hypothetical protein